MDGGAQAAETRAGAVQRITDALSQVAPSSVWRDVLAALIALATLVAMSGGLVVWLPWLQIGVVAGIAAGLVASSAPRAAAAAAIGGAVGMLVAPASDVAFSVPEGWTRVWQSSAEVVLAVALAAAVRATWGHWPRASRLMLVVALAIIIGNLWATPLTVNARGTFDPALGRATPSFNEQLGGRIPDAVWGGDSVHFFSVYADMRQGDSYYRSFREHYVERNKGQPPSSLINFRFPLVFWLWSLLPRPQLVVPVFLALASVAALCAVPVASGIVRLPLAIPAVAVLAAYFVGPAMAFTVFMHEVWAVSFGLFAYAAVALSFSRAGSWLAWTVVAVASAVTAALIRETLIFVMMGGALSGLLAKREQRTWRTALWVVGAIVLASAYFAHYTKASAFIDRASPAGKFIGGGLQYMLAALTYATDQLGAGGWLPWALALGGLLGAALIPRLELRVMALVSTIVPLAVFLFFGNSAKDGTTGALLNYWGAAVLPVAYASLTFAFLPIPGAGTWARRRAAECIESAAPDDTHVAKA